VTNSETATDSERRQIHFSGHVQGVGFRYTARQIAQRHAVRGYVQNLPDRRVLLVVEGSPAALDRYLAELDMELGRYIRGRDASASKASGEFAGFQIRH